MIFQFRLRLVQDASAKTLPEANQARTRRWLCVRRIHGSSSGCGSASIASGMNEADMEESNVARFTAWSFGLLSLVMLGLTVLDHL
jgi:hypothetical protein